MEREYEIHFAPLQGYTDWIFRNVFARHFQGITAYYTPFVRLEKGTVFRNRDLRDIDPANNRVKGLVPQILPGSSEEFRILASYMLEKGYRQVDINLGCSFPLIARQKKGAGMLPYPDVVGRVLRVTDEFPELAFSLKMRLGWENQGEGLRLMSILNDLRLQGITIHARLGKQQYKGETDPESFAAFYESCKRPLFYNGDLTKPEQIQYILKKFPLLRGVLLGRGLLSSPFLAEDFLKYTNDSKEKRIKRFSDFHKELFFAYEDYFKDERLLVQKMKSYWEYFQGEAERKLLKKVKKAINRRDYLLAVEAITGK